MPRLAMLLFVVALVAAGCAEASPAEVEAAPAAAEVVATTMAEDAAHDEEASHDDGGATHDEGAAGDDEAAHDDGEAAHDEETAHDDGEAAHDEESDHSEEVGDFDRAIEVTMTEFAFHPETISVAAGEVVEFHLINEGAIEHEFRLTTAHAADEHIASGHADHNDGGEGGESSHAHGEVVLLVQPGESDTVVVSFDADAEYEIVACLIPGHFEAGMLGDLTVEA